MTQTKLAILEEGLKNVKSENDESEESNVLVRLFSKIRMNRKMNVILKDYFKTKNKELRNILLNKLEEVIQSLKFYTKYQELKLVYKGLNQTENSYYKVISSITFS